MHWILHFIYFFLFIYFFFVTSSPGTSWYCLCFERVVSKVQSYSESLPHPNIPHPDVVFLQFLTPATSTTDRLSRYCHALPAIFCENALVWFLFQWLIGYNVLLFFFYDVTGLCFLCLFLNDPNAFTTYLHSQSFRCRRFHFCNRCFATYSSSSVISQYLLQKTAGLD